MDSPSTPPGGDSHKTTSSLMDNLLGLLRVRVKRGVNLAVRDLNSSDPYIVVKMGKQRLKTRVVHKNVNPEWNEDLTLSVQDPNLPIKLFMNDFRDHDMTSILPFVPQHMTVYDHDTFSMDDKMGDAVFDIKEFLEALRMHLDQLPSNTVITRVQPCRSNCLAEESCVIWKDGRVVQELCLRLRNVECGEVELELHWIDLPGAKGV